VSQYLGEDEKRQRLRGQRELLQGTVREIGAEHARQRQHRGKQRRHPDDARRHGPEQSGLRPDAERKQAHHDDEEEERREPVGTPPPGLQNVTVENGCKGIPHRQ